jgi:glycine/D-amino acid oxidase-like deaminating enzyme
VPRQVTAKAIVLATNAYTTKLGYLTNGVAPVHTHCAVTPPMSEDVFSSIGWKSRLGFYDSFNVLFHLGTTEDNRILIGGGKVDYFFNNGVECKRDIKEVGTLLHNGLTRIWPLLADVEFERVWGGLLGVSLDSNPSVGVTGRCKNIFHGLAYAGHGVALSFLFGKTIADLYRGESTEWNGMPFLDYELPYIPSEPIRWLAIRGYGKYLEEEDSL